MTSLLLIDLIWWYGWLTAVCLLRLHSGGRVSVVLNNVFRFFFSSRCLLLVKFLNVACLNSCEISQKKSDRWTSHKNDNFSNFITKPAFKIHLENEPNVRIDWTVNQKNAVFSYIFHTLILNGGVLAISLSSISHDGRNSNRYSKRRSFDA